MTDAELAPLLDFLAVPTPPAWLDWALQDLPTLLVDHAQCEHKAASTALSLMFRYCDFDDLQSQMSRLAREELVHFEQVRKIMKRRGLAYCYQSPSRYAKGLFAYCASHEPQRLVDRLIIGAFVEARSCERFYRLIPHLDAELSQFYGSLLKSEARHFEQYLGLARQVQPEGLDERIDYFRQQEAILITRPDREMRFHSGVPE